MQTGMPPTWASQTTAVSAPRQAFHRSSGSRVGVGDRPQDRPDVERLLALRVELGGEDVADRVQAESPSRPRAARVRTSRSTGSRVAARRGKRSPGTT